MNGYIPNSKSVGDWQVPPEPDRAASLNGRYVWLDPLDAERHAALLYRAYAGNDSLWDYMPYGPFHSAAQYHKWVRQTVQDTGHLFYAIYDLNAQAPLGVASYLRIKPAAGSIELGNICLSPALQGSRVATEAFYLMMQHAFDLGYRRFEWKCNALNLPSRRAAQRLGLSYEGVFRQATVVKGKNRDTAWFAAIDQEWPALQQAFQVWLNPVNFDDDGRQKERLSDLTRLVRIGSDPSLTV